MTVYNFRVRMMLDDQSPRKGTIRREKTLDAVILAFIEGNIILIQMNDMAGQSILYQI